MVAPVETVTCRGKWKYAAVDSSGSKSHMLCDACGGGSLRQFPANWWMKRYHGPCSIDCQLLENARLFAPATGAQLLRQHGSWIADSAGCESEVRFARNRIGGSSTTSDGRCNFGGCTRWNFRQGAEAWAWFRQIGGRRERSSDAHWMLTARSVSPEDGRAYGGGQGSLSYTPSSSGPV